MEYPTPTNQPKPTVGGDVGVLDNWDDEKYWERLEAGGDLDGYKGTSYGKPGGRLPALPACPALPAPSSLPESLSLKYYVTFPPCCLTPSPSLLYYSQPSLSRRSGLGFSSKVQIA